MPVTPATPTPKQRHDEESLDRPVSRPAVSAETLPWWFQDLVLLACGGVLSFGGFGLLLADLGHYSFGLAFTLGLVGTVAVLLLGRGLRGRSQPASLHQVLPALGACGVAVAVAAWNSLYIGHHVAIDRDPGAYAVAGRWLAGHGNLSVPAGVPWANKGTVFNWASFGMYPMPGHRIQFQFAHLLPVLVADGYHLGGDAVMFRVPALLGALALLTVYAVGCRVVRRPWLVLAAVTALAVSLPELYVTRDTFSEPSTQVLLWGGIWLLLAAYDRRKVGLALLAGLALGGTLMTRIDAVAYLLPLPLLAGFGWVACRSAPERRNLVRIITAGIIGALPPAILGTLDVQRRSTGYYDALHHQVLSLYGALVASAVVAVLLAVAWSHLPRLRDRLTATRRQTAMTVALIAAGGLLLDWSLRPAGPKSRSVGAIATGISHLQQKEGIPGFPQTFYGQSMRWLEWYLGPVALALAILGLGLLIYRVIAQGSPAGLIVLAMSTPITVIYIWNPSITPEQIWAVRRFVPATLPMLVLMAAVALEAVISAAPAFSTRRSAGFGPAVLGAIALVAFPLGASLPVGKFQDQANYLPLVKQACATVGPHSAVVLTQDFDGGTLAQTIRSWCNVPAAQIIPAGTRADLTRAAAQFAREGRTLWLLSGTTAAIARLDGSLKPTLIGTAPSPRELEETVERPVQHYASSTLVIYGAKVS